ncbi:redoxin domain-containing protein [Halobacterium yunchengense]|uniref:redoxin domain-containing protein n=1 Tax=Halobacterium yunchengense TaxID=3108497 RepID=UPI00300BEAD9
MSITVPQFELENVGAGESPFRLADALADDDVDAVVVLLQRDYHCRNCRQQVQDVAERYDEFAAAGAVVVSVLPEPADRAADWQDAYDLPYPLLADPEKAVSDDLDQPTRFGFLGGLHDLVGRMPEALVVDVTGDEPAVPFVHEGSSPADRPSIDELLSAARNC